MKRPTQTIWVGLFVYTFILFKKSPQSLYFRISPTIPIVSKDYSLLTFNKPQKGKFQHQREMDLVLILILQARKRHKPIIIAPKIPHFSISIFNLERDCSLFSILIISLLTICWHWSKLLSCQNS